MQGSKARSEPARIPRVMEISSFRNLALGIFASVILCACSGTGAGNSIPPVDSSGAMPQASQNAAPNPALASPESSNGAAPSDVPSPAASAVPSDSPSPSATPNDAPANWPDYPIDKSWKNGSTHGSWRAHSNGDGTIAVVSNETISNALRIEPKTSKRSSDTHAALVTTAANFDDFDVTLELQTIKQLRTGSAPNPHEVGWFLWHYTDDEHFYYFAPKTNGWELGKAESDGRHALASGTSPTFPIGTLQKIRVVQNGDAITVYDNGLKIVSFTDTQSAYASGRFGLYCEDSEVHFGSLKLTTSGGTQTL
jgi:Domain of Unknown Function (DUF1080)